MQVDTATMTLTITKNGTRVAEVAGVVSGWHFVVSKFNYRIEFRVLGGGGGESGGSAPLPLAAGSQAPEGAALQGCTVTMVATPGAECGSGIRAGDAVTIHRFCPTRTDGNPYHIQKGSMGAFCARSQFRAAADDEEAGSASGAADAPPVSWAPPSEGAAVLQRGQGRVGMRVVHLQEREQYGFAPGEVLELVFDDGTGGGCPYTTANRTEHIIA